MIFRIDSGIEFVMENLLDQSQSGHEKDNTKRNTNDSEAATRGKLEFKNNYTCLGLVYNSNGSLSEHV